MAMMHSASRDISRLLKGRTLTATFTDDMVPAKDNTVKDLMQQLPDVQFHTTDLMELQPDMQFHTTDLMELQPDVQFQTHLMEQ